MKRLRSSVSVSLVDGQEINQEWDPIPSIKTLYEWFQVNLIKSLIDRVESHKSLSPSISSEPPVSQKTRGKPLSSKHNSVWLDIHITQPDILLGIPRSARCVQKLDDSLNSAIHTNFHTLLCSSSMWEPRDPLLKVVLIINSHLKSMLLISQELLVNDCQLFPSHVCLFVQKRLE
jgi:hypothetical protein